MALLSASSSPAWASPDSISISAWNLRYLNSPPYAKIYKLAKKSRDPFMLRVSSVLSMPYFTVMQVLEPLVKLSLQIGLEGENPSLEQLY